MTTQTQEIQVQAGFSINFTMVQNEVMDSMAFEKPIDKLAYYHLLRFAFGKGYAFPSVPKLALMCSVTSLTTMRSSLKRLQNMGLLTIEPQENEDGSSAPNLYTIFELTTAMKENSVSNKDLFSEAKKIFKKDKKKKGGQKLAPTENDEKEGTKNDPPTPQNLTGEGTKNDPKEKELNNINLNNTKSLLEQHASERVFKYMQDKSEDLQANKVDMIILCDWIIKNTSMSDDNVIHIINQLKDCVGGVTNTGGLIKYHVEKLSSGRKEMNPEWLGKEGEVLPKVETVTGEVLTDEMKAILKAELDELSGGKN
ncbi:hypothetical protein [Priestia megaterium]|uniref:hypothetical protein n=1 Tax=Priestia megaterium TaxID=1404 RepID=UPI00285A4055|nr:hypothetical protein [Priestia megaterium]MDR7207611.1 hypothetical protein [Priestia megaterium]